MQKFVNADDKIYKRNGAEKRSAAIVAADNYTERFRGSVDPAYRHTYHVMPPVGWMNDPNGFNYAFGKYHMFFQFNPYSAEWGPMHWGHYTTEDFVKWHLEPTAIAPDEDYDRDGCFSGTSIVKDNGFYLMYTAVAGGLQTQALARSADGVNFVKEGQVITGEDLPADCSRSDFRDPKVFLRNGIYYAITGSADVDGSGQLLLLESPDLMRWKYVGRVWKDRRTEGIYECPDLTVIDGKDVLITSPQGLAADGWRHENLHGNLYMAGSIDLETGAFHSEYEDEIDGGFDFYAAQTLTAPDGRIIMTAWMQMWSRSMPTAKGGWAGAAILPRELSIVNGKLIQTPVREIEKYRQNGVYLSEKTIDGEVSFAGVNGVKVELDFSMNIDSAEKTGVKLYKGDINETKIYYDAKQEKVVFDRSGMGIRISHDPKEKDASVRSVKIKLNGNVIRFRIFLDVSSCEVFINGGERTMTGNVYSGPADNGICFFAEGGISEIVRLEKYDIVV
ncbi:MAG: glycoside hydrolase family 32 protein, partial [Clostridia bacterium]|nr:glycoside hydrolase family 32 protein [Clostridia bacterium]